MVEIKDYKNTIILYSLLHLLLNPKGGNLTYRISEIKFSNSWVSDLIFYFVDN